MHRIYTPLLVEGHDYYKHLMVHSGDVCFKLGAILAIEQSLLLAKQRRETDVDLIITLYILAWTLPYWHVIVV